MPRTTRPKRPTFDPTPYRQDIDNFLADLRHDVGLATTILNTASGIERKRDLWSRRIQARQEIRATAGRSHGRRLSSEAKEVLVRDAQVQRSKGATYAAIGRKLGLSAMTISRWLKAAELPRVASSGPTSDTNGIEARGSGAPGTASPQALS